MGIESFLRDIKILWQLITASRRGETSPKGRLDAFYRHQAGGYDEFRKKLLPGREEMIGRVRALLEGSAAARVYDIGGGTGYNLSLLGPDTFGQVTIVDLCEPLLAEAQRKIEEHQWKRVETVMASGISYQADSSPRDADLVMYSFSLSMMQDWAQALLNAKDHLLGDRGLVAVCDFYAPRKWPRPTMRKGSMLERFFWPTWFSFDDVHLSQDVLPFLLDTFEPVFVKEGVHKVPYVPLPGVPYYIFIGRKKVP